MKKNMKLIAVVSAFTIFSATAAFAANEAIEDMEGNFKTTAPVVGTAPVQTAPVAVAPAPSYTAPAPRAVSPSTTVAIAPTRRGAMAHAVARPAAAPVQHAKKKKKKHAPD